MVYAYLDAGLLAPLLGEVVEPGVVGRHEVAPLQHAQAGALDLGRGLARAEHRQKRAARHTGAGDLQKAAAARVLGDSLSLARVTHLDLLGVMRGSDKRPISLSVCERTC